MKWVEYGIFSTLVGSNVRCAYTNVLYQCFERDGVWDELYLEAVQLLVSIYAS